MDRRTALRRLAAGGATAAGVSAIVSSPAFADGGSVPARPVVPAPVIRFQNPTAARVDVVLVLRPGDPCPIGGGIAKREFDVTLVTSSFTTAGVSIAAPSSITVSPTGVETFRLTWGTASAPRARISVRIRYTCPGSQPGSVAWACSRSAFDIIRATPATSPPTATRSAPSLPLSFCNDVPPTLP